MDVPFNDYQKGLLFAFIGVTLCFIDRVHQVVDGEDIVQLGFGEQPAFQNNFTHTLSGFGTNLPNDVAIVVANEWVQISHDTN